MKYLFLAFLLLFCLNLLTAQKTVQTDTSTVVLRSFNKNALQQMKQDKSFQYNRQVDTVDSAWSKFWSWIWTRFFQAIRTRRGKITFWTCLIIFAIAVMFFFIFQVRGMNKGGLFIKTKKDGLPYDVSSEDIHGISFDQAINQAIAEGNFRMALRLLYLQSLKILSDKGYIEWQINKTNNDYIYEVTNKPWHPLFKSLTRKFEYTWYGEKKIGNEDFRSLQLQFQQFNNQLQ